MNTAARAPSAKAAPPSVWLPLRQPLFRALWTANLVSNIGAWMHDVGAGWLMTSLAPSPLLVSLVQAATTLPTVLLALPAGALADIVDRRRYLVFTQLWMLLAAAGLGLCTLAGITNAGLLLAFTFALGCGTALNLPAWAALLPELAPRAQLQSAVALNSMGFNVARAIGPALGGLIVASFGPATVFLLNAVSFLSVLTVLLRWRRPAREHALPTERLVSAIRAGLRYVGHEPRLQRVLLRGGGFFIFASALWALLPLVVRQQLQAGPTVYGAFVACIGLGAVGCAFVLPRVLSRLGRDGLVILATAIYAAALLALAHVANLYLLGIAMLASGAAWLAVLSTLNVTAQLSLPEWVRARGLAFFMVTLMAGLAGGSILWGQVANLKGIPVALSSAAVGMLAAIALAWKFRLGNHEAVDFTPSMHWPAPLVDQPPPHEHGPVLVTLEYRIDPARREEFLELIQQLGQVRRRDNAFFWEVFQDAADAGRFLECFMVESWLEHLRQHERFTRADRALQDQIEACLAPGYNSQVTHYIAGGASR